MKLFTKPIREQLLRNGEIRQSELARQVTETDFEPVVKLFTPDATCTWLLTELDPEEPDIAFGLCDLGLGCPELGYVSITNLESLRGKLGLPVERDLHFSADKTLCAYADEARAAGHIKA
ncbi:DUF2958 domain-containing protein [Ruegeria sp. HKCCA4812]|uniref:DUF2958 domain-containing protein n=1 Tax=Ruegeria sp. HKCCA4812 TaxID=2682993 RepID=UPI001487CA35|nr:DUF2958 domain-containing protein [Ruegeria sp. HKCCA4812]